METIIEIDEGHIGTNIGKTSSSIIFKPEKYKTYGAARKAIKTLMDATGYESLTQREKEIVGRWSLITDTNELNNLFDSNEQEIISDMHNSYIKTSLSSNKISLKNDSYTVADTMIYNGAINNEILKINVISRASDSNTIYSIRVVNLSNAQVIAEKTDISGTQQVINDLGTIQNQPTTNTILEIQIKVTSGSGKIKYESVELEFI